MKEFKPTLIFMSIIIIVLAIVSSILIGCLLSTCDFNINNSITVEDVLDKSECGYIVKDVKTLSILEPREYLDEEIVEIAVCCDTEDTLCIFISVPEEEEKIIVRNP